MKSGKWFKRVSILVILSILAKAFWDMAVSEDWGTTGVFLVISVALITLFLLLKFAWGKKINTEKADKIEKDN